MLLLRLEGTLHSVPEKGMLTYQESGKKVLHHKKL
jgi:hypothetical protein